MAYKNKEDAKAWREANKVKAAAYNKAYREANNERINAQRKDYRDNVNDGLYTVYFLPKENYVGMTTNLNNRIASHKCNGRYTSEVEIFGKYVTKREALDIETELHDVGFEGKNLNKYQQINK
tara:strand:+ start:50 stop:418 length:369 start_codon:yes stop_codon:yes gene_type:complete